MNLPEVQDAWWTSQAKITRLHKTVKEKPPCLETDKRLSTVFKKRHQNFEWSENDGFKNVCPNLDLVVVGSFKMVSCTDSLRHRGCVFHSLFFCLSLTLSDALSLLSLLLFRLNTTSLSLSRLDIFGVVCSFSLVMSQRIIRIGLHQLVGDSTGQVCCLLLLRLNKTLK